MALVEQRQQARKEKRWKDADALRDQVRAAGYEIEDTPRKNRGFADEKAKLEISVSHCRRGDNENSSSQMHTNRTIIAVDGL